MILYREFIKTALKMKDKIAVIDYSTKKETTYSQLLIASILLSKKMKKFKEKNIGIMIPTSAGAYISVIATQMAGKVPVMINYSTGAIKNSLYAQYRCYFKTIITSKKLIAKLNIKPVSGMIYIEDIVTTITKADKLFAFSKSKLPKKLLCNLFPKTTADDNAHILFTSGSEKEPKIVQLSHKNIGHNVTNIPPAFPLTGEDFFLGNLPLFHVFGLTVTFWLPIILGCTIVAHVNPLDYKSIVKSIEENPVSVLVGTPSFYHGYLRRSNENTFKNIRVAISGADKLPNQIRDDYKNKHNLDILEGYGTTETSPVISSNTPKNQRLGSIGKPLNGVYVKIINIDTDEILAPNEIGKILVKGDLVMKGYFGDIEETALHIHNDWYDTGDMGYLDKDGYLYHKGRLRRFVKIGGEMVSLAAVEDEINKVLSDDNLCCVVEVPNPIKGADLVAAITTHEINKKKIIKKISKNLPPISIPKEFFLIDELPMMGSGKVNFREVEKICRNMIKEKSKKR